MNWEFVEKNYLRAQKYFEDAYSTDPKNERAKLYRQKAEKELEMEAKRYISRGKRSESAGKIIEARNQYEAVIRLLYYQKGTALYKQAQDALKALDEKTGKRE